MARDGEITSRIKGVVADTYQTTKWHIATIGSTVTGIIAIGESSDFPSAVTRRYSSILIDNGK
jgi:hypothetical protein